MGQERRGISLGTLALASLGSAAATFLIARFGLGGTLVGAALSPVIVALVAEAVRRPAEGIRSRAGAVRPRSGAARAGRTVYRAERRPRLGFDRVSWRRVLLTGVAAFALVVTAVTVADLGLGNSVASDRDTTFFRRAETDPKSPAEKPDEEAPTVPTETVPPETPPPEEEPGTTTSPEAVPLETTPSETTPPETTTPP
jgi:hypothetical protein